MTRRGRVVAWLTALAVFAALAVGAYVLFDREIRPAFTRDGCVATVDGREVELSTEQAENAALIAAVAESRGLPARATTIALATAYQESKLRNITYGDRDSLGLFQQRPSQGWGTKAEVLDPYHSINAFYDALVRIKDYRELEITVAAQKVQRSAFPEAYADHEADARVLASALSGNSPEAFTCTVSTRPAELADDLLPQGLTPRAHAVLEDLTAAFGKQSVGGFEPRGVDSGHMDGSAHYSGRAVDIFFRPVNNENRRRGWAMAHYLVAHAQRLDIDTVIFDDRIWKSHRSHAGWRDYRVPTSPKGDRQILEHRDHVHVDVHR